MKMLLILVLTLIPIGSVALKAQIIAAGINENGRPVSFDEESG